MAASIKFTVVLTNTDTALTVNTLVNESIKAPSQLEENKIIISIEQPSTLELKVDTSLVLDTLNQIVKSIEAAGIESAQCCCRVQCNNEKEANIMKNSLQVDKEPKRSKTTKIYSIDGNLFQVDVSSPDVREMRIVVNSLLDLVHLTADTINKFGPPHPASKKICVAAS